MSEKVLTGKTALRRVLPVMIAVFAIILIAVIMSSVKSSSPNPEISDKDSNYLTIGQYKVSKEKLYTYLRKNYGVVELARLVDEKLLENEGTTITNEDTDEYIIEKLFDVEYDSSKHSLLAPVIEGYDEDPTKSWDELKDTLIMYGSLNKADRDNKDAVIKAMREYFALDVKREKYAESYYFATLEAIGATTENGTIFTDAQIKKYYDEHYSGKSTGIYIPFDSEEQAKRVMEEIGGINVSSSLLDSKKGWVSANYNPQSNGSVEYLTTKEVVSAFVKMYNYMMARELDGSKLADLTNDDYTISYDSALQNALDAIKFPSRIESDTFTLPTEIQLREYDNETNVITTVKFDYSLVKVADGSEFKATQTVNEENKTVTFSEYSRDNAVTVKVVTTATIVKSDNKEETSKLEKTLTVRQSSTSDKENTEIKLSQEYLTEKFIIANPDTLVNSLSSIDNDLVKFSWTHDEIKELDAKISTYLKYDGTLKVATNADKFYSQYTVTPIESTNYYFLMLKLSETEDVKLAFESDEDYEELTADEIAASDALKAEIVKAMKEDLFTTDIASKVLYEVRTKNSLTIYDRFLEAVYGYNYDKFFTKTASVSDYLPFNVTKATSKTVVASLVIDGKTVEITADELFAKLEEKYGPIAISSFIDDYLLLENNDVYNPFADNKIIDKDAYKEALKNEVATIRKNFEYDYFANSALEQYGLTPAFPASYGWDNFKEDYFGVTDDADLIANSEFGGSVYTKASEAYTKALYEDVDKVIAKIKENYADYYSVNVMNLVIYVDNNLDGTPDTYVLEQADYNQDLVSWTPEQEALVPELVKLLLDNAALTGEPTLTAQMSALVTLYNKGTLTAPNANSSLYNSDFFGKYKAAGIKIKWEDKATYDYKSSIVEEFSDELRSIYNDVLKANDLLDQELAIPVMLNNADGTPKVFATEFGYHYIAVTGSTSIDALPSDQEMKDIIAKYLYINSTEEEQATFKNDEGFFDNLAKLTEEEQKFITSWYSPATEEMSGSNPIALALIADRTSDRAMGLINFGNDEDLERRYNAINEILKKSYEEEE